MKRPKYMLRFRISRPPRRSDQKASRRVRERCFLYPTPGYFDSGSQTNFFLSTIHSWKPNVSVCNLAFTVCPLCWPRGRRRGQSGFNRASSYIEIVDKQKVWESPSHLESLPSNCYLLLQKPPSITCQHAWRFHTMQGRIWSSEGLGALGPDWT